AESRARVALARCPRAHPLRLILALRSELRFGIRAESRARVALARCPRAHPLRLILAKRGSLAARGGFEPTIPVPVYQFSRLPASTTCVPLRRGRIPDSSPGTPRGVT